MLKRAVTVAMAVAAAVAVTGFVTSASGEVKIETLRLIDTGASIDVFLAGGDASHTGDREVFRDTLIWAKDRSAAGKAEGHCTVIDASTRTSVCTIVTTLGQGAAAGTITTEGVGDFIDGETIIGAVTGGTGKYESATGHATFEFNPTGESDVTFKLQKQS
jgi:hypothetical protein